MEASNTFSILFYPKTSDADKNGMSPLFLRITVDSKRVELSLKRKVDPEDWCPNSGKVKGRGPIREEINGYLDELRIRIRRIQGEFVAQAKPYTASMLKGRLLNKGNELKTVLSIYDGHNAKIKSLMGKDYTYSTYRRHVRTRSHLDEFIRKEYGQNDFFIKDVDLGFVTRFEHYLHMIGAGGHNTITKYVTNFKKIVRMAFANNWLVSDPFFHWKAKWKKTEREALTEAELQMLMEKEFKSERLERARDVFIFCCFTGLSYVDVKKLTRDDIAIGMDGRRWIKILRTKTKVKSTVPLLPTVEKILKRYKGYSPKPESLPLLPVLSNQKANQYLKEISQLCGINKRITFHLSRHTFATTVTLANGVPIESVSKMLGHRSIKTTQIYAKVLDKKLMEDMELVRKKYVNA
ncbi:site-specific integrase [Flagellimonas sp. CMM7]|uniref:site-specific integrase n=1 Tax=Flagellimonas sp. CMM7 TaxID=2654676 RepID=UPI0013CFE9ED|nr:site-specific integrase [Flagellimonas sp. CMM7]UII81633.1 site-specific integrase [Flagellimonas sp. CMM7]